MSEQDRYIPGVPCWIDTAQPDPEAATRVLRRAVRVGVRGRHAAARRPASYFIARLHGGDVAAVGSQPEGAPQSAAWDTYVWVQDADETAAKVRAAGGSVLHGAVRRRRRRAHGGLRRPRRRRVLRLAGRARTAAPTVVNEHGVAELQRPPHARPRGREGVLRRGLRLGAPRRRRRLDVGAARPTATSSSSARPGCASRWPRWARPERFEDVVASLVPHRRRPARHRAALGRDVRRRRRRRDRRAGRRARRPGRWCRRSTRRGCA